MATILHYLKSNEEGEYIVITDADVTEMTDPVVMEFAMEGFELREILPLENTGILPTERILVAK